MSDFYLVMLLLAGALLITCEWPRLVRLAGPRQPRQPRRRRAPALPYEPDPEFRKRQQQEADEFAAAVGRDLDALPTIDEDEARKGHR